VRSDYPDVGRVVVSVVTAPKGGADVSLRIPAWAEGAAIDGAVAAPGSYETRRVETGSTLTLELPMAPRIIHPHPAIDAIRGTVAVERGPLVLALESTDLPDGVDVAAARLMATDPPVIAEGGAGAELELADAPVADWPYGPAASGGPAAPVMAHLIPYYRWANRGPSTMRVWLPVLDG
jgi:DUF1680 family protein